MPPILRYVYWCGSAAEPGLLANNSEGYPGNPCLSVEAFVLVVALMKTAHAGKKLIGLLLLWQYACVTAWMKYQNAQAKGCTCNLSCSSSSSHCSFFYVAAIKTLSKLFLVLFMSVFTSIICSLPFYLSPFLQEINISDLCCWWFVWFGNGVAEWKVD